MKTFKLIGVHGDYEADAIVATVQAGDDELFAVEVPVHLLSHISFLHGNYPMRLPPMGVQASDEIDRPDDGA